MGLYIFDLHSMGDWYLEGKYLKLMINQARTSSNHLVPLKVDWAQRETIKKALVLMEWQLSIQIVITPPCRSYMAELNIIAH